MSRYDAHTIMKLATEACRCQRAVVNALEGRANAMTTAAVKAAAVRLGVDLAQLRAAAGGE